MPTTTDRQLGRLTRSVYVAFGDRPVDDVLADVPDDAPNFTAHLAKVGDDPGAEIRIITPLGWLDDAEAGCLELVHWHDGTVIHFYVDPAHEDRFVQAVGGQHLGS